jgi:signal transduction histidine kinase
VLGFKPEITLIGPLDSAAPEQLSDDALATLRESLSNVVRNAEADAGTVLVGVDMTAKRLTIQVEDNGVGIDPQVTPGGRNTAARARASGGHATVVRRSEPGTTFTWVALPLEGKWEQITDAAGGKPCSLRPLFRGAATGVRTLVRTRWTAGP